MAGADGVGAHLLEDFDLPLQRGDIHDGAKRAEVRMITHALDADVLAVQEKAFIGVKLDSANAEGSLVRVHTLAVLDDGSDDDITLRILERPQFRMFDIDFGFKIVPECCVRKFSGHWSWNQRSRLCHRLTRVQKFHFLRRRRQSESASLSAVQPGF